MADEPQQGKLDVRVPLELEAGIYANFVNVWHTPHEFTLDFAVTLPPSQEGAEVVVPCQVVARVKIAPTLMFDLMRALNSNMGHYEDKLGEIRRPGADEGGQE